MQIPFDLVYLTKQATKNRNVNHSILTVSKKFSNEATASKTSLQSISKSGNQETRKWKIETSPKQFKVWSSNSRFSNVHVFTSYVTDTARESPMWRQVKIWRFREPKNDLVFCTLWYKIVAKTFFTYASQMRERTGCYYLYRIHNKKVHGIFHLTFQPVPVSSNY